MQDRPTATELLDAAAELLAAEVADAVGREKRFKVLVAANVCAVVSREIAAGGEPSREDIALFRKLLGEQPPGGEAEDPRAEARRLAGELAARVRAGDFDEQLDALAASLREHVQRKLATARPGYD